MPKLKDIAVVIRKHEKAEQMSNPTITTVKNEVTPSQPNHTDFNKKYYTLLAKERVPNLSGGFFKNISHVLFVNDKDGTELELYGCDVCLSLTTSLTGVRIHAGRLHNKLPKYIKSGKDLVVEQKPVVKEVASIDNPVEAIKGLVAELEYWKALAQTHEKRLAQVRIAITQK